MFVDRHGRIRNPRLWPADARYAVSTIEYNLEGRIVRIELEQPTPELVAALKDLAGPRVYRRMLRHGFSAVEGELIQRARAIASRNLHTNLPAVH